MPVRIIKERVSVEELKEIAKDFFGDMVKIVVDVEKEILAVGGELHSDEEQLLLENGSEQKNLWGVNYYFDKKGDEKIEFDSLINIRPMQNNPTREVEDLEIQKKIKEIINKLIK